MGASLIASVVVPVSASADPVADKKAQAAALAQTINAQGHQVEILAEQFNAAQLHQTQVVQQLADAKQRLGVAQENAVRDRIALHDEAIVAYIHGGFAKPSTPVASGGADLAVAEGYFRLATSSQVNALDRLHQAEVDLRQQQAALEAAQRESLSALANTMTRQQAVAKAAAATQATLSQVQGDLVQLVAQQQAAIAAQQQAQAATQLASAPAAGRSVGPVGVAGSAASSASAAASASVASASAAAAAPIPAAVAAAAVTARTTTTLLVAATSGPPPTHSPPPTTAPPTAPPPPPASSGAGAALAYARAQLGKPYLWGGAGPDSFDCSGLTMRAWGAAGVQLPHLAAGQYASTAHVPIADLQPGDLVFFGSDLHHVGIYVGGGQMIDAPQTGGVVSYSSINWPDLQPMGGRP